jgi:catechol 2,3-dioxygenase-like lactoylglutathione lyase family enzyme
MTVSEAPGLDREIYQMPMFVTLPVRDLASSAAWYEAVGFTVLATMPGPGGTAGLVHLRRMRYQDLLLVAGEPIPGPRITFAAGEDDLDARAERLDRAMGSTGPDADTRGVNGPVDTPWFTRDLIVTDPDGYMIVLTTPRLADLAGEDAWRTTVEASVGRHP